MNRKKIVPNGQHSLFKAGRLKEFSHEWKKLTSDKFIFNLVKGAEIPIADVDI